MMEPKAHHTIALGVDPASAPTESFQFAIDINGKIYRKHMSPCQWLVMSQFFTQLLAEGGE